LVEDGVNGYVAASADPTELAAAVDRVRDGDSELRSTTLAWFKENATRFSLQSSFAELVDAY
jgi:hypothetical protein